MAKKNTKKKSSKLDDVLEEFRFGSGIEHPDTALSENNIMIANAMAKAQSNGLTQGLDIFGGLAQQVGSQMMSMSGGAGADANGFTKFIADNGQGLGSLFGSMASFEDGGTVENRLVEVEGDEVAETPDGSTFEFKGPSHEEGGIKTSLPVGTEIYSDSIKIEGKTMAQRKKLREKNEAKARKVFEQTGDKVSKNTLERILHANKLEEEQDQLVQDTISNHNKQQEQFAYGGPVKSLDMEQFGMIFPKRYQMFDNINVPKVNFNTTNNNFGDLFDGDEDVVNLAAANGPSSNKLKPGGLQLPKQTIFVDPISTPGIPESNITYSPTEENNEGGFDISKFGNLFGSMTSGDMMGMLGNYLQTKGAKDYTLAERQANLPNRTFYDDYGKDTLKTLEDTKDGARNILDQYNQDLELSRNSSIKRNNQSARGINTMRALNIATDNAIDGNKAKAFDNFMRLMSGINGEVAKTQLDIDDVQAKDQEQQHLANQKDIAAFYENMKTNAINEGKLITSFGEAKNKWQQDSAVTNILEKMFPNFKGNAVTGEITGVQSNPEEFGFKTPDYIKGNDTNSDQGIIGMLSSITGIDPDSITIDNRNKVKTTKTTKAKKKK